MAQSKQALIDFYTGMGLTLEQAKQEADKVIKGVNEELKKGNPEAEQAGKDKVKSKAKGMEQTKGEAEKAGKNVSDASDKGLSEK
ncbi:hypothetical protein, partial [Bacillus manliponensis]